jgi:hypothetical protein
MSTRGPRGFAEAAYAYLSQAQNNGSAFAGYSGFVQPVAGNIGSHGIAFADLVGGWVMTFGRFVPIVAVLALAGALGPRRIAPPRPGNVAHRHPDLRHLPDRVHRHLLRPHLPDRARDCAFCAGAQLTSAGVKPSLSGRLDSTAR